MLLSASVTVIPASRTTAEPFSVKARLATVAVTIGRTALTLMVTVSVSVRVPPVPVAPRSLLTICRLAAPVKLVVGLKLSPFRAVLTAEMVPVNVIVASAVPSPTENDSAPGIVPNNVVAPLVLTSWTWTVVASTSLIEIRLLLPVENTFGVFVVVVWAPGTELTGASLTAVTAI